jgi:V/A-type H+-transporting ATPase subunit E
MSIENITNKILAEANEQSKQIIDEAKDKNNIIIENARRQSEEILADYQERAKEDAQLLKSRRVSVAELEVRKIRLGEKQALILKCFEKALDRLANMDREKYINFLFNKILALEVEGGELLLNSRDKESLGEDLVKRVNQSSGREQLTLSSDTIEGSGGFVLRKGSVEINSTLETMVNGVKEVVNPDVVTKLFG